MLFDFEEVPHSHCSRRAQRGNIVPDEVRNHDVLGLVLFCEVGTSPTRAFDRAGRDGGTVLVRFDLKIKLR
jgi:hypothetical protein